MLFAMSEMMSFFRSLLKKLEFEKNNLIKMAETKLENKGRMNLKILRKQFYDLLNYCLFYTFFKWLIFIYNLVQISKNKIIQI